MLIELRRIAITEDYLAPSSEVAQWVVGTFGHQLDLRRQAAGIAPKPLSERALAVPEVALGPAPGDSATAAIVHTGSDTQPDESPSQTGLLRANADADLNPRALPRRQRNIVLAAAGTMAAAALVIAFTVPDWLRGGFVDEYGTYVEDSSDWSFSLDEPEPETKAPTKAETPGPTTATGGAAVPPTGATEGDAPKVAATGGQTPTADDAAAPEAPPPVEPPPAAEAGALELPAPAPAPDDAAPSEPSASPPAESPSGSTTRRAPHKTTPTPHRAPKPRKDHPDPTSPPKPQPSNQPPPPPPPPPPAPEPETTDEGFLPTKGTGKDPGVVPEPP